jgi:hypothetical protein
VTKDSHGEYGGGGISRVSRVAVEVLPRLLGIETVDDVSEPVSPEDGEESKCCLDFSSGFCGIGDSGEFCVLDWSVFSWRLTGRGVYLGRGMTGA